MRDSLHQAPVPDRHVGTVVDDVEARAVELGGEDAFGDRHADRVCQSLPQGTRGRLNARSHPELGVTRRLRMQLPEALELIYRQVVTGEMQERVQQHRAVAVGHDEAVAIGPLRMRRVVAKVALP